MVMMDFERVADYLDDRYTPAEVIDMFDIPMVDLVDCLWDYLQDKHKDQLNDLINEGDDDQLDLPF